MADKKRIGFIGLGIMGSRMAKTLSKAGHGLTVFDVDRSRMDALKAAGASVAGSPRAVAQSSEMVFSSLPVPATVKTVYLGPDGVLEGAADLVRGAGEGGKLPHPQRLGAGGQEDLDRAVPVLDLHRPPSADVGAANDVGDVGPHVSYSCIPRYAWRTGARRSLAGWCSSRPRWSR